MPISVVMPALEMAQETGKLISWLKKEGEAVAKGEPLLEIETDKAVMEVESPGEGLLAGISVQPGTEVPVGRTIAWIVQPGEKPPVNEVAPTPGRKITTAVAIPASPLARAPVAQSTSLKLSPKARRLAAEHNVDLNRVQGSGPDGEILAADILAAAKGMAPARPVESASAVARLMAERTTQSWTTVPHFYLVRDVDASALNEMREQLSPDINAAQGIKLTHTDLLVALVARVLVKHPGMNAGWVDGRVRGNSDINIAIAIAVEGGVVAPVIHHADKAALAEIALRRRDLVEKARAGKLRPQDLAGGTFTVSNLGMFGVDAFNAIITPPQAAILAVGRIADRVVPVGGQPAVRPMMTLTLSSDHRVVDGAGAAEFLTDLADIVSVPATTLR